MPPPIEAVAMDNSLDQEHAPEIGARRMVDSMESGFAALDAVLNKTTDA